MTTGSEESDYREQVERLQGWKRVSQLWRKVTWSVYLQHVTGASVIQGQWSHTDWLALVHIRVFLTTFLGILSCVWASVNYLGLSFGSISFQQYLVQFPLVSIETEMTLCYSIQVVTWVHLFSLRHFVYCFINYHRNGLNQYSAIRTWLISLTAESNVLQGRVQAFLK